MAVEVRSAGKAGRMALLEKRTIQLETQLELSRDAPEPISRLAHVLLETLMLREQSGVSQPRAWHPHACSLDPSLQAAPLLVVSAAVSAV